MSDATGYIAPATNEERHARLKTRYAEMATRTETETNKAFDMFVLSVIHQFENDLINDGPVTARERQSGLRRCVYTYSPSKEGTSSLDTLYRNLGRLNGWNNRLITALQAYGYQCTTKHEGGGIDDDHPYQITVTMSVPVSMLL